MFKPLSCSEQSAEIILRNPSPKHTPKKGIRKKASPHRYRSAWLEAARSWHGDLFCPAYRFNISSCGGFVSCWGCPSLPYASPWHTQPNFWSTFVYNTCWASVRAAVVVVVVLPRAASTEHTTTATTRASLALLSHSLSLSAGPPGTHRTLRARGNAATGNGNEKSAAATPREAKRSGVGNSLRGHPTY